MKKPIGSILNEYYYDWFVAKQLGIHVETVKRYCRSGRIIATKIAGTWIISEQVLRQFQKTYKRYGK